MSYLNAILRTRIAILQDNEEPRDVLISSDLRHALRREMDQMMLYRTDAKDEWLMGMKIEWTKPVDLTKPLVSIRTTNGDTRVVNYVATDDTAKGKA